MIHFHIHTTEYSGLASTLTEMSSLSFAINIFLKIFVLEPIKKT